MVLEAAMSMKLHRIGTVTPRTHDLLVKTPWVRSLLTMSRTSERTVSSKASWLPNHTFTHFFTNSRSQRKAFPDSFTWSCSQTSGEIERDHLQLLLHNLQISEVPSQGAYKYVGSDQAAQENHRNKRGIGHDSVTGRSPKKVSGSITAEEVMNIAMETGPRRTGLMINSCSVIEPFCFLRRLQVQTSTTSALSRLDPKEWASNRTFSAAEPWLVSSLFHEYKSCPRTPDLEAARTASPQKWPESQSTVTNARGQRRWIRSGTRQGDRQSQRETSSEQPPGCPRSQLRPRCKN